MSAGGRGILDNVGQPQRQSIYTLIPFGYTLAADTATNPPLYASLLEGVVQTAHINMPFPGRVREIRFQTDTMSGTGDTIFDVEADDVSAEAITLDVDTEDIYFTIPFTGAQHFRQFQDLSLSIDGDNNHGTVRGTILVEWFV